MQNLILLVAQILDSLNKVPITKWLVAITLLALVSLLVAIVRLT